MATTIQHRRGTTAEHATFTGAVGEVTFNTDTNALVTHDGVTPGGFPHVKISDLAASSGSSLVSYMPDGISAQMTDVESKLKTYVCVFDFMTEVQINNVVNRVGTIDVAAAINAAIAHVFLVGGGTVWFPAGVYKVLTSIMCKSYVNLEGAFGETTDLGAPYNKGTTILWAGATNGVVVNCFNVRLFKLDGFVIDADAVAGVTGILLDCDNNPSGSQNEFHRFSIRNALIGVQWGTSGLVGSYANDGTRFSTFTIWSQVLDSKGFVVNSGNAGQMCVIESGGIQVDGLGIDVVAANILQIRRVFGGGRMKIGFIRTAYAQGILIEGCSSECWGPDLGLSEWRHDNTYFLITTTPVIGESSLQEFAITMVQNQINNPILCNQAVRIVSIGDNWGACKLSTNESLYVGAKGIFTALSAGGLKSVVTAVNNGTNVDELNAPGSFGKGWQDSAFVTLLDLSPDRGWVTPTYSAGDFTCSAGMTWTVDAGDVETYAYTLVGKTMTVAFKLNATSISGTPGYVLSIKIPKGKVAAKGMLALVRANNLTTTIGMAAVSGTNIDIQPIDTATWAVATNSLTVQGQITFEVA